MQVPIDAAGEYSCRVGWSGVSIDSESANLQVLYISKPVPTNVPYGADATFSCNTPAMPVPAPDSITFHYLENTAEKDLPNVDITGRIATVVISGVTEAEERDYYCKAKWGEQIAESTAAALNVLNILADESSSGL